LRFWVASVDFTFDVAISQAIMASVANQVKMIRNRARFLLGNISDFDPEKHAVPYDSLTLMDKHIILRAEEVFAQISKDYDSYAVIRVSKALTDLTKRFQASTSMQQKIDCILKDRIATFAAVARQPYAGCWKVSQR